MAATTAPPDGTSSDDERHPELNSPQLAASVRRGAVWSVASTIALRFGSIAATAVVAHILDRQDFGVFTVALTALMIVTSFGELGVASCLVRADLDIDLLAPTMVTVSLISGLILAGVLVEFALPIATALGSAAAAAPVRIMAISAVLAGVFAVPNAQLSRDFQQDKLFMSNLVAFVPSTAILLLMAKSGSGAMAFAWSRIVGQIVAGGIQYTAVSRRYRPGLARAALGTLVRFGLPLGGANFVGYVLLNVDYAFVGHLMGAVALGVYVLGFNVASWPVTLLSSMIGSISMPAISRVKDNVQRLRAAIIAGVRALALVVAPICALSVAFAHQLVATIYGAKWASAAGVLIILAFYGGISIICMLFANIISGLGRSRSLLVVQLVWLAALVPAMAEGVRRDGIDGAAAAHLAVIAPVVLPCYVFVLKRTTRMSLFSVLRAVLPPVVTAAAAAVAAVRIADQLSGPQLQLVVGLVTGGLAYGLVMAPQLVGLLSDGMARRLGLDRLGRAYAAAGRLVGLRLPARPMAEPVTAGEQDGRPATLMPPTPALPTYTTAMRATAMLERTPWTSYTPTVTGTPVYGKGLDLQQAEQTLKLRAVELRQLLESGRPGAPHVARHARGANSRAKRK
jgi:lipopolysaccharide exporter